ncbi:MAG: tetratricopeptide repeat protein [Candidatus Obscuribacterales bacterium]|nr:tetratricopeptide repeat protein [Candidatus Obscuribacterales bacterium]
MTKKFLVAGLVAFVSVVVSSSMFSAEAGVSGVPTTPSEPDAAQRAATISGATCRDRTTHYLSANTPDDQPPFAESEVERLQAEGLGKFSQANFAGAINDYTDAIKLAPTRGVLYLQRGLARIEEGLFDLALADLDKALEFDKPNSLAISICRGKAHFGLKNYERALDDFSSAIKSDPKASLAFIGRAEAYLALGEDDKSLRDLERALKLDPAQPHAYFLRAQVFKRKNMKDQAIEDLHKAVELDKAYLAKDKDLNVARTDTGDNLAEIIKLNGKHSAIATKLIGRGLDLERAGDHLSAIKEFTDAILASPDSLEAYKWRAELYMSMSSFELARDDLSRAIEITPADARLHALRAKANLELGYCDESIKDYSQAIDLSAGGAPASLYEARGLVYSRHGNSEKAVADFSKAIAIEPTTSGAYLDRGLEHIVQKNYAAAIEDFTASIKNGKDTTVCYKFRGQAKRALGDKTGALEDLEKAAALYEKDRDLFGSKQVAKLIARIKHGE